MTKEQILALKPGDEIETTFDTIPFTEPTQVKPNAKWGFRGAVTEISFRGTNIKGGVYVGGYHKFGDGGKMSFSVSEGEEDVRLVPPEPAQ